MSVKNVPCIVGYPTSQSSSQRTLLGRLTSRSDDGLNLIRVDQPGNIGRGDLGGWEIETRLGGVNVVKSRDGTLSPDDESTDVTTWCELKEVKSGNWASLNTWDVSESLDETFILVVNDERTTTLSVTPVPHLSLTGTDLSGVGDLDDIGVSLDGLEELNGDLGLGHGLGGVGDDEGNLLDLLDSVTTGEDEGWESRGGKSRGHSVSALTLVDLFW